nr:glycine betaine ABC transporter substrate-binding protein [Actinoplanes bogorensis]
MLAAGCTAPAAEKPSPTAGCAPVAGDALVVLEDDQRMQDADNIVPAINQEASSPELIAALDRVSAALDTTKLIALNKAVTVDRKTSKAAAQEFAAANSLTTGVVRGSGGQVIIGAGVSAESATLAQLYAVAATAAGYTAKVRKAGPRKTAEPALVRGDIDVLPEYAASLATYLAGRAKGSPDLQTVMTDLTALGRKRGLVFGRPAEAQHQNAFAVTAAFADRHGLKTLSDLAGKCSGAATVVGGPATCPQRPNCQLGLVQRYGFQAGRFSSLDQGGLVNALRTGGVSVGSVLSSDPALAAK